MKKLTEAQAWRRIADAYEKGEPIADTGFCWAVKDLWLAGIISDDTRYAMKGRIHDHMNAAGGGIFEQDGGPWAWSPSDSDAKDVRVLGALFLALEAEDE